MLELAVVLLLCLSSNVVKIITDYFCYESRVSVALLTCTLQTLLFSFFGVKLWNNSFLCLLALFYYTVSI